jgi:hypothetical protein
MQALLTAIVTWLSINFALPADYDHPALYLVPQDEISHVRYPHTAEKKLSDTAVADSWSPSVMSVYDSRTAAILLPKRWQGVTPAELSILVHEMVHHLQYRAGTTFACPAER